MLFSMTLVPPIIVSYIYSDQTADAFFYALLMTFLFGLVCWFPFHREKADLRTRDGFMVTVLFWLVLALSGSLPFMLAEQLSLNFTDAFFESLSGWTTTGATVITGLDSLPESILFYRQQLQWLGGMGIIVLAVAVLPMLGIGGMQLFRAESPGPVKDSKLTPRITETAKALWYIYLSLTIACALGYWLAGMSAFDAICHSFSTVAIGGFSTHDASIGYFENSMVEMVCIFFMIISAFNFALHFFAWRSKSVYQYFRDPEIRFLLSALFIASIIVVGMLYLEGTYNFNDALQFGVFELVSVATTTGFGTADFSTWPSFVPFMIFMLAFMGGCAGSTGGGLKVIRVLLIQKQGAREMRRLIHPNAMFHVKLGRKVVDDRVIEAVWGFLSIYIILYMVMTFAIMATGLDFVSAFSAVGAAINNLGPGLGEVSAHYGDMNSTAKWIMCFAMLLGRLEIFTLLVLFTPAFWRH
jgi:trk system potassium uptake protein TrkH